MNFLAKKIIGIDFHDKLLEIVEIKQVKDSFELETFNRIAVPDGLIVNGEIKKPSELQALLLTTFKKANPKAIIAKEVAILLPSKNIFTHIFKLPLKLKDKEIKTIVAGEAENVIPFALEDVYWDFSVIEREDEITKRASQYILFAATPKAIADGYAKLLTEMSLTPILFGIYTDALKYALGAQMDQKTSNLIIEFGPYSTNYLVIKNGLIKSTLSSAFGSEKLVHTLEETLKIDPGAVMDMKESSKLSDLTLKEIAKFIGKVYKQTGVVIQNNEAQKAIGKIKNIYLTGEYSNLPNFLSLAQKTFPNKSVVIGDPKSNLSIKDDKFQPAKAQEHIPYSVFFTNAIGIAKAGLTSKKKNGINLLPETLKSLFKKKKIGLLLNFLAVVMASTCLAIAAITMFIHQDISYARARLEVEKSAVQKLLYGTRYQEIHAELTEFNAEVAVLSNIDNALFSVPAMLEKIYDLIPEEIALTSFSFDDADLTINLTGVADTREDLFDFQKTLGDEDFISAVVSPISNYDKKTNISFHFEISLKFSELPKYGTSIQ